MSRLPRPACARHLLALGAALSAVACGSPTVEPEEPGFEDTSDASVDQGLTCLGACSGDGAVYTSMFRVGATATSRAELLQTFAATADGPPPRVHLVLRTLRVVTGAHLLHVEIFEPADPLAPEPAAPLLTGAVPITNALSGVTPVTLEGAGTLAAGGTYALRVWTDEVAEGEATLLVGVGVLVTSTYAEGAAFRHVARRTDADAGWGETRARPVGEWDVAFTLEPPAELPAPALTASAIAGGVRLAWSAVPGASGYELLRGESESGPFVAFAAPAGTTHDDLLPPGSRRWYRVRALNGVPGQLSAPVAGVVASANGTCTNTPVPFTCACNGGYTGDGVTCTPVLAISPSAGFVVTNGTLAFSASGGAGGYTFSKPGGGGTLSGATFTAPATPGSATIRVTDALGATADATVTIYAPLVISPSAPSVVAGGTVSFSASGGVGSYTFSKVSGGGTLSGTTYTAPATAGSATIRVTDSRGLTANTVVTITPAYLSGATKITVGYNTTCAVVNGVGKCWGLHTAAALNSTVPVTVSGLTSGVTSMVANNNVFCAVQSGAAKCWGSNYQGMVGDGTDTDRASPTQVSGLTSGVSMIETTRNGTTIAGVVSGGVKSWGTFANNGAGSFVPVNVTGLSSGVTQIAVGSGFACALVSGAVKCWGSNVSGQLGNGTTTASWTPVTPIASGATDLAAALDYTCAVVSGTVKCWGTRSPVGISSTTPVTVAGIGSATQVAAGNFHACAVTSAGGVKCWGWNDSGQLGDNTTTNSTTPVDVVGLSSGVSMVAASGWKHTCALLTNGSVKCWGSNANGELGDGTRTQRLTPVSVLQ